MISLINLEKFSAKIDRSDGDDACWPWTGSRDQNGYGVFSLGGRKHRPNGTHRIKAHRLALMVANGTTEAQPGPSVFCCHRCDNPPCCNPAHLFWGTCSDNCRDASIKGRLFGGRARAAKLSPERRSEIAKLAAHARWGIAHETEPSALVGGTSEPLP
jgi:hypothetical protein